MITPAESFPDNSIKYLLAQDIFWTQFNDIYFYVEDKDREKFYLQVLKKLFPLINISKIFPLGGKELVINEAKKFLGNKKKVYILDLDFDEILNKKISSMNLFYLKRYSIENYLLEKESIKELIYTENVNITDSKILKKFNINLFYKECKNILSELAGNCLLIQKYSLGIKHLKIDTQRDIDFSVQPTKLKKTFTTQFFKEIEDELKRKRPHLKYAAQISKTKKYFNSISKTLINIPGKYLINILQYKLKKIFNYRQTDFDTFIYRLVKECKLNEFDYLKTDILKYIK